MEPFLSRNYYSEINLHIVWHTKASLRSSLLKLRLLRIGFSNKNL